MRSTTLTLTFSSIWRSCEGDNSPSQITGDHEVSMRVYERGSGETRSCGTGTCAVALAASLHSNERLPSTWIVNPPGGRLEVVLDSHSNATLTGPAVLIKDVDISRYVRA